MYKHTYVLYISGVTQANMLKFSEPSVKLAVLNTVMYVL